MTPQEWGVLIAAAGFVLTGLGIWAGWVIRIGKGEDAKTLAENAHKRLDEIEHDHARFRETVAREYASKVEMSGMEARIMKHIDWLASVLTSHKRSGE